MMSFISLGIWQQSSQRRREGRAKKKKQSKRESRPKSVIGKKHVTCAKLISCESWSVFLHSCFSSLQSLFLSCVGTLQRVWLLPPVVQWNSITPSTYSCCTRVHTQNTKKRGTRRSSILLIISVNNSLHTTTCARASISSLLPLLHFRGNVSITILSALSPWCFHS